ncbi:hypothetical protein LI291_00595 [Intestinibacillus massiliensis]|uniref:hypothetical protein n=1 Tax=Intestinibacillus massiliensis TaxID=1871029 RepID=UPI000B34D04B|nr:hypothetical protein [Intestinibacillus massiliensis]MCB6364693.1 hypothetical protein [Intestinibacillus massiliensis]
MQVKYIGENDPRALITGKVYPVIATEYGWYLIKNESGKAYMYPPSSFEVMGTIELINEKEP